MILFTLTSVVNDNISLVVFFYTAVTVLSLFEPYLYKQESLVRQEINLLFLLCPLQDFIFINLPEAPLGLFSSHLDLCTPVTPQIH